MICCVNWMMNRCSGRWFGEMNKTMRVRVTVFEQQTCSNRKEQGAKTNLLIRQHRYLNSIWNPIDKLCKRVTDVWPNDCTRWRANRAALFGWICLLHFASIGSQHSLIGSKSWAFLFFLVMIGEWDPRLLVDESRGGRGVRNLDVERSNVRLEMLDHLVRLKVPFSPSHW